MKKPIITGNSQASKEIMKDGENCLLCRMEDPHAIAEAILRLKTDDGLQKKIAEGGYATFKSYCSPVA